MNSHTQEQNYLVANNSISQNNHPIFSLLVFNIKEYIQNSIKNKSWKLLLITSVNTNSQKLKDITSFITLQTLAGPSTEACWQGYFCISHWNFVGCRWASHHNSNVKRETAWIAFSADLDSGVRDCPGTRTRSSVDLHKGSWTTDLSLAQVWGRYQVAQFFQEVSRYGRGQRHSLRGLGNFRRTYQSASGVQAPSRLTDILQPKCGSEGQIKLTPKS